MNKLELFKNSNGILDKPELRGLKVLFAINMFLLITDFLMPQYFGIDLGFDITCTRFANVLLVAYSLYQINVFNLFSQSFLRCFISIPLTLYLFVAMYTTVLRTEVNAFMLPFLEILTLFMLIVAIRYVIGVRKALKIVIFCAYFLSIYGFIEFAAGESLYLKFLRTLPSAVVNVVRSGYYRIMGPCGHALGYGLLLIIFVAVACVDYDNDGVFLFKRPLLLVMLIANVFLTGSRSSQGIMILEIFLIVLFSGRNERSKSFLYLFFFISGFTLFLIITYKTPIGKYIMLQITSLIDQFFDTEFSVKYGAELSRLKDSENYREFLPYIFKLEWLNPLVGRGAKSGFSAEIVNKNGDTAFIHSIDNYYVSQYIKYAYPGLVSYALFILSAGITMIYQTIKYKSGIMKALTIGFCCYFINLWWVDALQTLKFVYVVVALFFAIYFVYRDVNIDKTPIIYSIDTNESQEAIKSDT